MNVGGGSDSRFRGRSRDDTTSRIFMNVGGGSDSRFRGRSRDDTIREYS